MYLLQSYPEAGPVYKMQGIILGNILQSYPEAGPVYKIQGIR